jgi:hypothetical protein|tara:strand:+ start:91 stop:387 length:297 start_codon:yes stop_codon:yes gene_type:complete
MPTYTFINQATGEVEDHFMSWTELEDFHATNPHLEKVITAPAIISGVEIRNKQSDGFKEVMSKIAEKNPGSSLDGYRSKSHKEIKTKSIVEKHRKMKK